MHTLTNKCLDRLKKMYKTEFLEFVKKIFEKCKITLDFYKGIPYNV